MNPALKSLVEYYNIPVHSYVAAIQHINSLPTESNEEYVKRIKEITSETFSSDNRHLYRFVYLYLVQELIRASFNTDVINVAGVYALAVNRANIYLAKNHWVMAVAEAATTTDSEGNVKPKKKRTGAKRIAARALWDELAAKRDDMTRKEWIALLVEKVDLTPAGASTYYQNLKSGLY